MPNDPKDEPTMLQALKSPTDYMLRVAAEEIDFMEKEHLLADLPHVAAMLRHRVTRYTLQHLQNFCWTVERAWRRVVPHPLPEGTVREQYLHPPIERTDVVTRTSRQRVWIDVTNTYRTGKGGGIGRVALELADAAIKTGLALPVVMENGCVRPYFDGPERGETLQFDPDTIYVIVDSFWEQIEEYRSVCATARACGAKVVACIHDVIPLYYPTFCRTGHIDRFAHSFEELIELSDACIAVSDHSRRQVEKAITEFRLRRGRPLPLTYFHLGADGHVHHDVSTVRSEVREIFARGNVFLSVGTLEPRKGYAVTLDAFDELWRRGIPCELVIIGRPGWISKSLQRRIVEHPHNGTTLHWILDASDAELTFAYRSAYCLIQASITEGFGLPVVEARFEGTPVIATDIEVFHELGGDQMVYFNRCDGADLAAKIENSLACRPSTDRPQFLRWDQSLEQMLSRISEALAQPVAA